MKLKILFNGFRHSHVNSLYQKVQHNDAFEIAGCLEENADARKAAEMNLGAAFSDASYDQWLESDIDIVAIGGAYGERGEAVIKALAAGKHVIADKPICTDIKQLEQIKSLCIEKERKLVCMLDLRYLPQSLAARQFLRSGKLGSVRNISFNGQHYLDYGKRPGWYFEPGMHGGTINDLEIHGIDLVRMMTEMEFATIDTARCWNAYAVHETDFKDCALFVARLENGAGVMADISYSSPNFNEILPTYWEFRVWCDFGMLTFNYRDEYVTVYEQGMDKPQQILWNDDCGGYLADLRNEIKASSFDATENVLKSTAVALRLQKFADKETFNEKNSSN